MLLDLNNLADELIEEALTSGKITLSNGLIYQLKIEHILRILAFIKAGKPVKAATVKKSILPDEDDDFNMDHLLFGNLGGSKGHLKDHLKEDLNNGDNPCS